MKLYIVRAVTETGTHQRLRFAESSFDAHAWAIDRYGPCSVFVVPR